MKQTVVTICLLAGLALLGLWIYKALQSDNSTEFLLAVSVLGALVAGAASAFFVWWRTR